MAFESHIVTVRRLKKYIDDVIGKKANLPDTSKTIIGNISQINSDLTAYDNFNYNLISTADFAPGDTNTFTIPNDTLLVRVHFWYAGTVDPQICYLNFDRRMPRLIQIADHYDATNGEARMTVEVNWRTMTTIIVSNSLPNSYWHIGIQFYK